MSLSFALEDFQSWARSPETALAARAGDARVPSETATKRSLEAALEEAILRDVRWSV